MCSQFPDDVIVCESPIERLDTKLKKVEIGTENSLLGQTRSKTEYLTRKEGESLKICRLDQVLPILNNFKYLRSVYRVSYV